MSKTRVLIVDSNVKNIAVLEPMLAKYFNVLCVTSAEHMRVQLNQKIPHIIILNTQLQDESGFDVLKELKHGNLTQHIPVLVLCNGVDREDATTAIELGAWDYLSKPFNEVITVTRLKNLLEIKQKSDLLEVLASIDSLTEIPNKPYFEEHFSREFRRCMRGSMPISLVVIDIDFFKRYNEYYGHKKGDDCLKKVASTLVANCQRGSDFVARIDGARFAAVLSGCDKEQALGLCCKLKAAIQDLDIPHLDSPISDCVTITQGIAAIEEQDIDYSCSEMMVEALQALERAQVEGRDTYRAVESL